VAAADRLMSLGDVHAETAHRVAGLSADQAASLHRTAQFVLDLVACVLAAPAAERAARYAQAKAEGRRMGLQVEALPATFNDKTERELSGFLMVARATECATRPAPASRN